jgi:hypothetical protein
LPVMHQNQLYLMGAQILYRPIYRGLMVPPMKPVLCVADLAAKLGTEVLWSDLAGGSAMLSVTGRSRPWPC